MKKYSKYHVIHTYYSEVHSLYFCNDIIHLSQMFPVRTLFLFREKVTNHKIKNYRL